MIITAMSNTHKYNSANEIVKSILFFIPQGVYVYYRFTNSYLYFTNVLSS